ncbi:MAG TPA: hypothetical protein PLK35_00490 [Candidatus Moranbacteria bacterium]|nr:hypothetical protein [Candidatus Moranbacteria bacterium]
MNTGEEQVFITHIEESEGFMEPKDIYEVTCTLKVRDEVNRVGYWTYRKNKFTNRRQAMRFKGNPFQKTSYNDSKTPRNLLEVVAVAARDLKLDLVNGCCHNIWLEARSRSAERRILAHAETLSEKDPRILATVESFKIALRSYVCSFR